MQMLFEPKDFRHKYLYCNLHFLEFDEVNGLMDSVNKAFDKAYWDAKKQIS
jgi:hypothetical protein